MLNPWKSSSKVNPQTEKGTRRIASDLWLALTMIDITVTEQKVLMAIIHCTWGFKRLDAKISYGMLALITGKHRTSVIRAVKKLVAQKLLVIAPEPVAGTLPVNRFMLNKYYDTWVDKTGSRAVTSSQRKWLQRFSQTSSKHDGKLVAETLPYIFKDNKEIYIGAKKQKTSKTELNSKGIQLLKKIGLNPEIEITEKPVKKKKEKLDKKDLEF